MKQIQVKFRKNVSFVILELSNKAKHTEMKHVYKKTELNTSKCKISA